jgi:uroporphyrinogen decarboxylase
MSSRERVLATLRFQRTDHVPYNLMEGAVWPELMEYFRNRYGLADALDVQDFLSVDFRHTGMRYVGPPDTEYADYCAHAFHLTYSDSVCKRPLADAHTVADVEAYAWPDPAWFEPGDYRAFRQRFPDHAIVAGPPWMPTFCYACVAFGMEEVLVKMLTEPLVVEAFCSTLSEIYLDMLERHLAAAEGLVDICSLADDWGSQDGLIMGPKLWRRFIKPHLARYLERVHAHGMVAMMHSCGSIRSILPDLVDIGLEGLTVFQTTCAGMDASEIAREFGGKMVFSGGIDTQWLLSFGTPQEVAAATSWPTLITRSRRFGARISKLCVKPHGIQICCRRLEPERRPHTHETVSMPR